MHTRFLPLVLLPLAAACSRSAPTELSGSALIGGAPATDARFDAIGSLGVLREDGSFAPSLCTGTLVDPTTVLTSKSCSQSWLGLFATGGKPVDPLPLAFAVGPDGNHPRAVVEVTTSSESPEPGGLPTQLGSHRSDVAIVKLARPIEDVEPLVVSSTALTSADVGKPFTIVGFGLETNIGVDESLPLITGAKRIAKRAAGTAQLDALGGNILEKIYGTLDAYIADRKLRDPGYTPEDVDAWKTYFANAFLVPQYQAWVGATGGAQSCFDLGGPVLVSEGGALRVIGVMGDPEGSSRGICGPGQHVALFGPATRIWLDEQLSR